MPGTTIASPDEFRPLDVAAIVKLWVTTKGGTEVRMANRIAAIRGLAVALNHLLGRMSRITFQTSWSLAYKATGDWDPFVQWRYIDEVANERTMRYRTLAVTRTGDTGFAYAEREGDTDVQTAKQDAVAGSNTFPEDVYAEEMDEYERGDAADALATEGVSTYNSYAPLDICIHAKEIPQLDISSHAFCPPSPTSGTYCLANILEEIRAKFHELRTTNLPIVSIYAAQAAGGNVPTHSDQYGLTILSTTYVNFLDGTSASRTATTPGDFVHCQFNGRGNATRPARASGVQLDGELVPCRISALLGVTGSVGNAAFKVIGPAHVASNESEVTTVTGVAAWYDLVDPIYLNSTVDETDVSTSRNKLDFHGKAALTDKIHCFGWIVQQAYEI